MTVLSPDRLHVTPPLPKTKGRLSSAAVHRRRRAKRARMAMIISGLVAVLLSVVPSLYMVRYLRQEAAAHHGSGNGDASHSLNKVTFASDGR